MFILILSIYAHDFADGLEDISHLYLSILPFFCALVCKNGFLFFNFLCFCTIDLRNRGAIGEYGGVF
nr:MAG TPA: hypothetical protein [Caudoviricetes sp.]